MVTSPPLPYVPLPISHSIPPPLLHILPPITHPTYLHSSSPIYYLPSLTPLLSHIYCLTSFTPLLSPASHHSPYPSVSLGTDRKYCNHLSISVLLVPTSSPLLVPCFSFPHGSTAMTTSITSSESLVLTTVGSKCVHLDEIEFFIDCNHAFMYIIH